MSLSLTAMSSSRSPWRARSVPALAVRTALVAGLATLAVAAIPHLGFAYRAPALRVALETANAMIALLVAYLVYGRFRASRGLQDLLLVMALCTVAVANLVLTALPSAVALARDEDFSRWEALAIRFIGTVALATAALVPATRRSGRRAVGIAVTGVSALVVLVAVAGLGLGDGLPPMVDPALRLEDASAPRLIAHPLVTGVHALGALLYGSAAVGFTRQASVTGDHLVRWVGAACVLGAFARVHYMLFPSLYSDLVYTGDLLRLGFYLFMLVGASREIRSYWEARAQAAVLQDRRRMARDLHDGLAQELTYIRAQSQRLAVGPGVDVAHRITAAAERASDEARRAISALTRPVGEAFPGALQRVADELAHRHDVKILTDLDDATEVDAA